jgi:sugar phosphate permease
MTSQDSTQDALNSATRRALLRLLPFLILMYLIAFIDRSNIGYVRSALQADAGISDAAYAFGAGIFFLSYALFEIPSNLMLYKVGAPFWLARIMITWGIISAATAFVSGTTSFYIVRTFLGAAEAGFFPGVILYLTLWFPANVRARVLGTFYFGLPLALVLGGPMSGLLLDANPPLGMRAWQWMFLVEGLLACVVGAIAYFYLTASPSQATWLTKPERDALVQKLADENAIKAVHGAGGLRKVFTNPKLLAFCAAYFTVQVAVYGVVFYLPTRIAALMGTQVGLTVGLLTAIPWLVAIAATWAITRAADRSQKHRVFAACMLAMSGVAIICTILSSDTTLVLIAFCFAAAGFVSVQPLFWTLPTTYFGGVAAAGGIAMINSIGNIGGFVAPNLKTLAEQAFNNPTAGMICLGVVALLGSVMMLALARIGNRSSQSLPVVHAV